MNPVRRLLCAIAFLTRAPLPASLAFDGVDVGRSTIFFPLVGAGLGGLAVAARHGLDGRLPPTVIAVLLVALGALATGALHLDGVADSADGLGGGRTREDVLRIMRDHAIGAYGGLALILIVLLKVSTIAALVGAGSGSAPGMLFGLTRADAALIAAPALARWVSVPLGRFLPYARTGGGVGAAMTEHVGAVELVGATLFGLGAAALLGWRGAICAGSVGALSVLGAIYCLRRIGGITGDTLGANTELAEALVYLLVLALP